MNFLLNSLDNIYLKKTLSSISSNINPRYLSHEVLVQSGDSFEKILKSLNLSNQEIDKILTLLEKYKSLKKIKKYHLK